MTEMLNIAAGKRLDATRLHETSLCVLIDLPGQSYQVAVIGNRSKRGYRRKDLVPAAGVELFDKGISVAHRGYQRLRIAPQPLPSRPSVK